MRTCSTCAAWPAPAPTPDALPAPSLPPPPAANHPQPENKAAMLQHPEYVPEALQSPDGFVRASACTAARKGGQPQAIVDAVCASDAEVPWPTAEAMHAGASLDFVSCGRARCYIGVAALPPLRASPCARQPSRCPLYPSPSTCAAPQRHRQISLAPRPVRPRCQRPGPQPAVPPPQRARLAGQSSRAARGGAPAPSAPAARHVCPGADSRGGAGAGGRPPRPEVRRCACGAACGKDWVGEDWPISKRPHSSARPPARALAACRHQVAVRVSVAVGGH